MYGFNSPEGVHMGKDTACDGLTAVCHFGHLRGVLARTPTYNGGLPCNLYFNSGGLALPYFSSLFS
jgi:hypothetical protein